MNFDFIKFDYPYVLFAFVIFIPIILYDIFSGYRKNKLILQPELLKKLKYSTFFFRIFIVFSIIALCGPRWGTGYTTTEYRSGLDAVFAIDVSRSMDIHDAQTGPFPQSRLERGLSIARESAVSVSGARFAAVLGRSRGYLAVPLTYDNEAALGFLEALNILSMTGRSTNLELLVEAAVSAFADTSPARKIIVLISDGESHFGDLRKAANLCAREGIIITAVATGSDEGMPVSGTTGDSSENEISKRNTSVMRMAAEITGGIYIDAGREDASSLLSSNLLSLAQKTMPGGSQAESKRRHTLFIILAIIAYAISKFLPRLSSGKNLQKSIVVTLILILSSCSQGKLLLLEANYLSSRGEYDEAVIHYQKALQFEDSAPYAEYGLGLTFYLLDEGNAALNRYANSKKILETLSEKEHRELRYRNYYNSGVIFFEEEDYISAADSFKEALRINPGRIEAKYNLEISLMSIIMETNREKPSQEQNETREILFDYIKQLEQQYWKSTEWENEEQFTGKDY
jgi:Ca-activated chloride channel family protein